ncbi:tyrosine-type recombinase/integrase [Ammonifex thiophilus]|uniref:Site-specific integrase n=1 Tax=Ammonifex thiophilus TaxID=444093 RepID=A0A3D8P6E1_9THEO|nr:tyrosine-type recombinase/integrase [Ammonifex thiophilus]RDV84896.1 site-specific integrase [Ammonifex thiophilus]
MPRRGSRRGFPTWEDALQQYLCFKQAQGLKQSTVRSHAEVISLFFKRHPYAWEGGSKLKKAVYAFLGEKIKPATYNIRLAYLSSFFKWCLREGIFTENPVEGFKKRKAEGRIVSLDIDTLRRLVNLPDRSTFTGLRDYALILLTLDTGIRPSEAFSLLPEDINLRSLEVYVRADNAKTRISRTLPISPATAEAIKQLLQARHPAWGDGVPVFCTQDGTPLNRYTWSDRLEIYSKRLGVKIRPYDLRHAFALWFLRNGGHALALQRTLGHRDLTMTKVYVALTQQDLKEQHDLASPVNAILPRRHRVRKIPPERR